MLVSTPPLISPYICICPAPGVLAQEDKNTARTINKVRGCIRLPVMLPYKNEDNKL